MRLRLTKFGASPLDTSDFTQLRQCIKGDNQIKRDHLFDCQANRTVIDPNDATLYEQGHHGKGALYHGVRECDYKISPANPNWVLASDEHGLSFSSTVKHAVGTMKFLGGFQKKGTKINCAYWIFEGNQAIPTDMAFVQDPDNPEHYLLTITKDMKITDLVYKLRWISQRMTTMKGLTLEAYKDA